MFGYPMRILVCSKFQPDSGMKKYCFSRISFRRDTRPPKIVEFRKAIPSAFGAVDWLQFAIRSALMLGAEKVFAMDHHPQRLDLSCQVHPGQHLDDDRVETINFDEEEVYDSLMEATGGRGPDACIDAVGLESHGTSVDARYDRIKVAGGLATDRIHVLRQAARVIRKKGDIIYSRSVWWFCR